MNEKLFNPDYLRHLCQKYGLRPSRQYGQNFLLDENVIEEMVDAAQIKKDDIVVEVGPGFGALTFALAQKAKKVIGYEIEKKLEKYWNENSLENLEIVWGNVLKQNPDFVAPNKFQKTLAPDNFCERVMRPQAHPRALAGEESERNLSGAKQTKCIYKVVANLPYQITSNVIRYFLENDNPPETMVLMVQKEVGKRICAQPGDLSILALSVQYYATPEIVAFIPRTSFFPQPKVDSAVIKISLKKGKRPEKSEQFFKFLKTAFVSPRKTLVNNLAILRPAAETKEILAKIGLNEKVRPQELSLEQWKNLIKFF